MIIHASEHTNIRQVQAIFLKRTNLHLLRGITSELKLQDVRQVTGNTNPPTSPSFNHSTLTPLLEK